MFVWVRDIRRSRINIRLYVRPPQSKREVTAKSIQVGAIQFILIDVVRTDLTWTWLWPYWSLQHWSECHILSYFCIELQKISFDSWNSKIFLFHFVRPDWTSTVIHVLNKSYNNRKCSLLMTLMLQVCRAYNLVTLDKFSFCVWMRKILKSM